MRSYKDHGKNFDKVSGIKQSTDGNFKWVHDNFGSNFRMTEMQAAIGLKQLAKVNGWVRQRQQNCEKIIATLQGLSCVRFPESSENVFNSRYRLFGLVDDENSRNATLRDKIINIFHQRGIPCFQGTCPEIYLEQAFLESDLVPPERLANAKHLSNCALMFLVHHNLGSKDMELYCEVLDETINEIRNLH